MLTFALERHDEVALVDGLLLVAAERLLGAPRGARLLVLLLQPLVHVQQEGRRRALRRRARAPRPLAQPQQLQDLVLHHQALVARHRVLYHGLIYPIIYVQSG